MTVKIAIKLIKKILKERLKESPAILREHSVNEAHFEEFLPDAVAYVNSAEEVSEIAKICSSHECPITAWGTGTSLEGHSLAVRGGIVLNMGNMNKVFSISTEDMDVIVQPGLTREELNKELKTTGLFFSVDPGANASIGGMAATRASGTTTLRYGSMRENVLALQVVLADGRIIRTGSRARKSSAGYDLTKLLVGSEGTLGIITELTLRLHAQPDSISAAICSFPDIESAVQTVISTIQMAIPMARMEFVDDSTIIACNQYFGSEMLPRPHLFMEFHGTKQSVQEQAKTVKEIATSYEGSDFVWSLKAEERSHLWNSRHKAFWAIKNKYPDHNAMATDVCVPISKLAEIITQTHDDIKKTNIPGPLLGHVGDGNFHATLLIRNGNKEDLETSMKLADNMAKRALLLGGTVTGEHGIGMGKIKYMEIEHGEAWDVMTDIKRILDPNGILNPGKLVKTN